MNKLQEASRNELLALTKSQTVTRYNKSEEYKGFTIKDIKTDEIFNKLNNHKIDFSEVKGQEYVKRALEISAAGAHNCLLIGSPRFW